MRRAILVALAVALAVCKSPTPAAPPAPPPREEAHPNRVELTAEGVTNGQVRVEDVRLERFGPVLLVPAEIEADPRSLAQVGARTSGRVVAIRAQAGAAVNVGDPLVEIDAVELHQVTQEHLAATARLRQAEDALERQRALGGENIGSMQDLRRAEADLGAARAAALESEERLHTLGLRDADIARLRSTTSHGTARSIVRAPVAGRVSRVDVTVGQVVASETRVAVVGSIASVWAALHVYERDLGRVRIGLTVRVRGPEQGAAEREGIIASISDVIDPVSRTVEARVAIDNADGLWRPGMTLLARVLLPTQAGAIWIPREAVQPHDGHTVIFVRVGERAFEARPVRVGEEQAGRVPVEEGLRVGEPVVVAGAFSLRGELERGELEEED